ncbi:MAG: isoprenylcysteine carboxylmethyltransferase family protein [Chitinophagales bacterium]
MLQQLTLYVALFFFASEIILSRIRKSSADTATVQQDKNTLRLLWIVIMISMVAGVKLGFMFPRAEPYAALRWSGLAVFILGFALRWSAILQLGKGFTVDVSIGKEHQLQQSGLYSVIRHPSYLGVMLEFLGYSLLLNSWYPLFIINIPVFLALHHRMNIEEDLLISHFGNAYRQYKSKTKRLVPFLY